MTEEWTSEIDPSFARAVHDRLDAVAALGVERRAAREPAAANEPPWTAAAAVEDRLAEAVDGLIGLEGATARVADEARRVASGGGDVKRAFSTALALASSPEPGAAAAGAATLRSPRPDLRAAAAEALALGRRPAIGAALTQILDDAGPASLAAALGVLRARRQATFAPCVILLGHPEARVVAAAARALATVPERRAAAAVLRRLLGHDPDEEIAVAAAEGLLALGDAAGLAFVRAELSAEIARPTLADETRIAFVRLLALGGDADDVDLFFRSLEPSPRDVIAVGWFGHPDLVDWLLGTLETAVEARRAGARGRASPATSPVETAVAAALARLAGNAEPIPLAGMDGAAFRAFWARARGRLPAGPKLRFGRPYTPEATLSELRGEGPVSARADAALELSIVSAGAASVEPTDWIARQRAALAAAADPVAALGWPAGAFPGRRMPG